MTAKRTGQSSSADGAPGRDERIRRAVALARAGGDPEEGFRLLFDAYYRPLQRFFVRKGCSHPDAADLTQETFLGIYRGLNGLRQEARFEAWLYQIATTFYLKKLRSGSTAKRAGHEVGYDEIGMGNDAARLQPEQLGSVLDRERREAMRVAVRELPAQMRRCLVLRVYHDLSYREIATAMKLKIDTVKAHLFQARARLKQLLGPAALEGLDNSEENAG